MFQVSEDDILPKYICIECWTKVMDFHKFYEAVDAAKQIFTNNSVKDETPNIFEINCDAVEFDADIGLVKSEPSSDADESADNSEQTEYSQSGAHTIQYDNGDSDVAESIDKQMRNVGDAFVAVEKAIEITAKVEDSCGVNGPFNANSRGNEKFDHLILEYMKMHCEICQQPFATLSEAISHYRSKHQRRTVTLKCCQRRIKMPDIRDHIQYHLTPDVFK